MCEGKGDLRNLQDCKLTSPKLSSYSLEYTSCRIHLSFFLFSFFVLFSSFFVLISLFSFSFYFPFFLLNSSLLAITNDIYDACLCPASLPQSIVKDMHGGSLWIFITLVMQYLQEYTECLRRCNHCTMITLFGNFDIHVHGFKLKYVQTI